MVVFSDYDGVFHAYRLRKEEMSKQYSNLSLNFDLCDVQIQSDKDGGINVFVGDEDENYVYYELIECRNGILEYVKDSRDGFSLSEEIWRE